MESEITIDIRNELMSYILSIVGNEFDAEDLVHDTLLSSIEKHDSLHSQQAYKQWLFRIGRNKAIDFLKIRRRCSIGQLKVFDISSIEKCSNKSLQTLAEKNRELFERVSNMWLNEKKSIVDIRNYLLTINPDIVALSTEHIEALIYADIEKRKLKDIAVQLAIPLPTVKSRI